MLRRAFLSALAAVPGFPVSASTRARSRDESRTATPVEREGDMWFWYYVYSATTRDRVMSTPESRELAVSEMNLTALSDAEAREVLRRANAGGYTLDDMPDQWRRVLRSIDQVEFT